MLRVTARHSGATSGQKKTVKSDDSRLRRIPRWTQGQGRIGSARLGRRGSSLTPGASISVLIYCNIGIPRASSFLLVNFVLQLYWNRPCVDMLDLVSVRTIKGRSSISLSTTERLSGVFRSPAYKRLYDDTGNPSQQRTLTDVSKIRRPELQQCLQ
jgi:hypothetical protein